MNTTMRPQLDDGTRFDIFPEKSAFGEGGSSDVGFSSTLK